jgi:hypothetical protein
MQVKMNAKLAIRMLALTVGLAGTFITANSKPGSVADGGPILVCPPSQAGKTCQINLPPMVADGGPILVCPPSQAGKQCQINLPPAS